MSKILVIEPHRMLCHAFAVALSPEYQVEVSAQISDRAAENQPDLVIVDAAALSERDWLGAPLSVLESWKSCVIWIDTNAQSQVPTTDDVLRLKWPVDREALKKAVADCLGNIKEVGGRFSLAKGAAASIAPAKLQPRKTDGSQAAVSGEKEFIELVDIVD